MYLRNSIFKTLFFVLFLLAITNAWCQDMVFPKMGSVTYMELEMQSYDPEPDASALILDDVGYASTDSNEPFDLIVENYCRVKIFKKEGFSYGTIRIKYHKKEVIYDIEAKSYHLEHGKMVVQDLQKSFIFKSQLDDKHYSTVFTLPDLQEGCVIEYTYKKRTPFYYNYGGGWNFQNTIPALKSTFFAKIPAYWKYHIATTNNEAIVVKQNKLIKNCLKVGLTEADCLFLELEELNVPSLVYEDYTTSIYNFIHKVNFKLEVFTNSDMDKSKYTQTWKNIENEIFEEEPFGNEYGDYKYLLKSLPAYLFQEKDELLKAKEIYKYIQEYFINNNKSQIFQKFNQKKIFEERIGSVTQINTILINALLAAGLDAKIALSSTRENGFVTKLHPVLFDFNYLTAYVKIDNVVYLLDASDKMLEFGRLPFDTLNGDLRIFSKNADSFWYNYTPFENNETFIYCMGTLDNQRNLSTQIREVKKGYEAYKERKILAQKTDEEYMTSKTIINEVKSLENFKIEGREPNENPLILTFQLHEEIDQINPQKIYLSPFVYTLIKENPFKLDYRTYPVDFGYPRKTSYAMAYKIPDNYEVSFLPKNRNIVLPNDGGEILYVLEEKAGAVKIVFKFSLNQAIYQPEDYSLLKSMYATLLQAQSETIILTKKP